MTLWLFHLPVQPKEVSNLSPGEVKQDVASAAAFVLLYCLDAYFKQLFLSTELCQLNDPWQEAWIGDAIKFISKMCLGKGSAISVYPLAQSTLSEAQ